MTFLNLQLFYFELYFSEFMFTYFNLQYQIDNTCLLVCASLQDINSNLVILSLFLILTFQGQVLISNDDAEEDENGCLSTKGRSKINLFLI